jgi:hypothetical protein
MYLISSALVIFLRLLAPMDDHDDRANQAHTLWDLPDAMMSLCPYFSVL